MTHFNTVSSIILKAWSDVPGCTVVHFWCMAAMPASCYYKLLCRGGGVHFFSGPTVHAKLQSDHHQQNINTQCLQAACALPSNGVKTNSTKVTDKTIKVT